MVYKPSERLRPSIGGPCEKTKSIKRPLCIGASIEQRPWKPTTRKGAIGNEFMPGKPSYQMIPTYMGPHVIDSRKKSAPAYSLGRKSAHKLNITDGGPAKVNIRGLCNKGLQTAPAFSLKWREQGVTQFQTPSANKYSVENSFKATSKTIPKFSFGKRPVVRKTFPTPAPNVYNMPPILGTAKEGKMKSAPAFTMLGRAKPRQIPALKFPGPGNYETNYRYLQKRSPRYTLHTRHKIVSDEDMKPGPAAHCPKHYIKHKSVPAPSFAIKHTPFLGQRKAHLIPEAHISAAKQWLQ